jgi:predicted nucleic acid-binding Zn ribbon protein
MISLKDLLPRALQRAKVSTQVYASRVVAQANEFLVGLLGIHAKRARAASFRDQTLTIEVLQSATGEFIREHEAEMLAAIHTRIPDETIRSIRYRVVYRFRGSEL